MSNADGPRRFYEGREILKNSEDIPRLIGDGFELELANTFLFSSHNIPGYEFNIKINGETAGKCSVLIEPELDKVADVGNFGVTIERKFFGRALPSQAARACYPLFTSRGQDKILITHDENNRAIEKACEELKAEYLDTKQFENQTLAKKRYLVNLNK